MELKILSQDKAEMCLRMPGNRPKSPNSQPIDIVEWKINSKKFTDVYCKYFGYDNF